MFAFFRRFSVFFCCKPKGGFTPTLRDPCWYQTWRANDACPGIKIPIFGAAVLGRLPQEIPTSLVAAWIVIFIAENECFIRFWWLSIACTTGMYACTAKLCKGQLLIEPVNS